MDQSSSSKKSLGAVISSVASTSGVGHLVGIAEQTERKSMKDQIKDLRQEISDLGLSHLIDTNSGVGMQLELKQLTAILSEHKKQQEIKPTPSEQEEEEAQEITKPQQIFGPRRNSFALKLASQAETMGIQTSPQQQPKRRLSTLIKSVASTSGVGHLVGIAEQTNRKPMREQVQDLKQEITLLGLGHLIADNHKAMSLSAEIKALKKILSDHQKSEMNENSSGLPRSLPSSSSSSD
jgi:regulator of replication initiation timing